MKLLVYPNKITPGAKLDHLCKELNIEIINNIEEDFDLAIYWNYNANQLPDKKLIAVSNRIKVINIKCNCVLKSCVDNAWELAAGYSITVDPMNPPDRFYIRKSQLQYQSHTGETHDGRIFDKPQGYDNRYVYQKLIETGVHNYKYGWMYRAIRAPVFNENIPCLFIKDGTHRFKAGHEKGHKTFVKIVTNKRRYLTRQEIRIVIKFCKIIGVEYAEIDLLRDKENGLLYAVDVNNIAGDGIFGKLPHEIITELKTMLAQTFKKEFCDNFIKE